MRTPAKARAAINPPVVSALGRKLHAITPRHWVALETIGSPVIGAGKPGRKSTLADYLAAVLLLALGPVEAGALANDEAALRAAVDAELDKHTLADLQAAANAVIVRVAEAMGIELKTPAAPTPPESRGAPAGSPRDPTTPPT